jgi:peptidoglycan/LPS O-acetylase OafA/YrhL
MENPPTLSPGLLIFMVISLILSIWAIIDIFRSNFSRLNKFLWLLVVLFAPFGMLIYFFVGRRLKPALQASPVNTSESVLPENKTPAGSPQEKKTQPFLGTLIIIAGLCIITYINVVSALGREKTEVILLGAMALVGSVLIFVYFTRLKKKNSRK